ncbi:MAG: UDP-N-acetylglucosamine--N-acetylmuramyl-(pentapeptide) pyrophosphoryl-undecaprenol N-acetylglucosamine transferase, partial [Rhodospirillaceae bacterium]
MLKGERTAQGHQDTRCRQGSEGHGFYPSF